MKKSIDGESIFLSDAGAPPLPRVGINDVPPTVLVGSPANIGGEAVRLGESLANIDEGRTVLCEDVCECCVGWLLVITGPMKGKSYSISNGRNSVGRSVGNKVVLPADDGISRTAQVYVVYDPEENVYVLTPGDGSAIARLNGQRLDAVSELRHGDIIALSKKTMLRFIPACDAAFKWED